MRSWLGKTARCVPGLWRARAFLRAKVAAAHRRRLGKTTFVAVTGSAGKSTTTFLSMAVLGSAGKIRRSSGTLNDFDHINRLVIATPPDDDFSVIEVSAGRPGAMDQPLGIVRPVIGVVTSIGTDHMKAFQSVEAIAEEKSKVVSCLPAEGTAVLNADDPLVLAMKARCAAKVITYGRAPDAVLRAEDVHSAWPERLCFTAVYQGESVEVRTRLCGTHWTTAVLAALAVGLAAGIPLAQAAEAIAAVEPHPSRMYPVSSNDGITFIMDDWKASLWTFPTVFDFLKAAQAERKVMIIGTLSDYTGTATARYRETADKALEVAEHVIFVGPQATLALRAKRAENAHRLHVYTAMKPAAGFLRSLLQEGDLVLLKGSMNADHLGRLAHHWLDPISCWRMDCRKNMRCERCVALRADVGKPAAGPTAGAVQSAKVPDCQGPYEIFVGIGNPGDRFMNSPHNLGFEVLDKLAGKLDLAWRDFGDCLVAQLRLKTKTLLLIKPQEKVNHTGKSLERLSGALGFAAEDCLLVHDDTHMPLGKLRYRGRGSDGGHKGVRSALVTFQTDRFRRLKIGVSLDGSRNPPTSYLISPFAPEAAAVVAPAIDAAVERLLETLSGELPEAAAASLAETAAVN